MCTQSLTIIHNAMFTCFFLEFSVELPPPNEDFDDLKGIKTITEYKINDDGKRVKVRFQSGLSVVYRARMLKVRRIQNRFAYAHWL